MNKEEKRLMEACTEIICTYLNKSVNIESISDIYEIRHGHRDVLYSHIDAYCPMFNDAKEILERVMDKNNDGSKKS